MFCTQCGAKLNDGVKFCGECGADTSGMTSAPAAEPTQAMPAAETQAMPAAATQAIPEAAAQATPAPAPAPETQALPNDAAAQQGLYGMGATQVMPTTYAPQGDVANGGYQATPNAQYQAPGAGYPYGVPGAPGAGGPGAPGGPRGGQPQGKGNGKIIGIIVGIVVLVVIIAVIVGVVLMGGSSSKSSAAASASTSASASSQVASSSAASSSAASSTASSSATSSSASSSTSSSASSPSASSASSGTADVAAEARKKAEGQGKLVLEGTLHVTTNAERAKQVDPNLKGFEKDNTQLIWLEVNPAVQVNGIYPGDATATPKAVKAFNLGQGDKAALAKLDGQHVLIAIEPDAAKANRYWPTDLSGVLFDVGGPFELIYAK
ncbi:MAG: zinc ribbon domain-containing protein [Coriobacteriaceae bacterium]|nr:zinc ribbon domain-containing protein [Coriobacteriaceae bacterium]